MFNANADANEITQEILTLSDAIDTGIKSGLSVTESLGCYYLDCFEYDRALIAFREALVANPASEYAKNAFDKLSQWERVIENSKIYGRKFVITGTLEGMERDAALQLTRNLGGLTSDAPVNDMDYLVVGNLEWSAYNNGQPTRKILKAEDLQKKGRKIRIIGELEFFGMLAEVAKLIMSPEDFKKIFRNT